MTSSKKVLFMITRMNGGGAERVIGILASEFAENGYDATLMLTNQRLEDAVRYEVSEKVKFVSLLDVEADVSGAEKLRYKLAKPYTRVFGTACEKLKIKTPDHIARDTFMWQNYAKVDALRKYLSDKPDTDIIVFLQPSVNIALLATANLPNRVILSERLDPARYGKNRYMPYFAKEWYPKAYGLVFQTHNAQSYFPENVVKKSKVIYNPLNPALPAAYSGSRKKTVVNFCRITEQKNLPLLVDAFELFCERHPDYDLEIWGSGDAENSVKEYIGKSPIKEKITLKPFSPKLHETIREYAMFVSSSDYEGMSNSMLEALAIGLPSVCTDCPAGGAAAIINDHENGILVPVRDKQAMCNAMFEIAEDEALSEKLSANAAKLGEELSVHNIARQWMEMLENE